ncbi:protein Mdm4 [Bombina bombina]|uniref:protein Mdm4 n=1 Tax=Bombina bombina TaxID=8345 RepID=UPI00235AD306|nr:protein Mdm4 [Bombina bombina]
MSTSTSSQQLAGQNPTQRSTSSEERNPVRPQPALLKLLHTAGAKGDTFTLKQVMHHLGQYIMVKQLYDKQQQHIVHCEADELGQLLGISSFSVKDPSPLYNMLKKNLYPVSCTDAAQSPSRDPKQDTSGLDHQKETKEIFNIRDNCERADGMAEALSVSQNKRPGEDLECPANSKQPRLDLVFEEWDGAGLPWWFLGNLRTNYNPQSNGSTDIPSNQDIDTALVSDTTDDLWFLNDCRSDQINMEVKVEAMDSPRSVGEEVREAEEKKVIELTIYEDNLEDTQSLSDDTDTEITSEDCWQCTNCHKFNSPMKRYCFRCWALRKDWYLDCPRLTHALSTPTLVDKSSKQEKSGIDIPDCRRTISAPVVRPHSLVDKTQAPSLESLDLAKTNIPVRTLSESTDTLLTAQSEEASLASSRPLLEPCQLCHRRPRNGNVIHGRTAHLVTCFPCGRSLQKTRKGCPVCQKPIQMVVKTYVA